MKNKVSIIVPVYNSEKYINECIDSILAQSYVNFELILIDDGSTDKSGIICDNYKANDPRIKVFHTSNSGASSARNFGIDIATGDYISFVDSDDVINSNIIETLVNAIEKYNLDFCACGVSVNQNDIDCILQDEVVNIYDSNEILKNYNSKYISKLTTFLYNKVYKKQIFDNLRLNTDFKIYEDEVIALDIIEKSSKIGYIDKKLYYYRQSDNSLMRNEFDFRFVSSLDSLQHMINFMKRIGCHNEVKILEFKYMKSYLNLYGKVFCCEKRYITKFKTYKKKFFKKIPYLLNNKYVSRAYKVLLFVYVLCPKLSIKFFNYLQT